MLDSRVSVMTPPMAIGRMTIKCFLEIEKNHGVGSLGLSSHASSGAKIVHSHGDWEVPSASDLLMLEKGLIYICLMITDGTMYSFPNM
jgi:hypothetical protein